MNILDFYKFIIKQKKAYLRYGMDFCKYHEYKNILKNIFLKNGDVLLDIGCSDSYFPWYLSSKNDIIIYLADLNEKVLIEQKKNFQKMPFANSKIKILQEDITQLANKSNCFDLVFAIQIFSLLPSDMDIQAIKEIYRVLKKNGQAIISISYNVNYSDYENSSNDNYWNLKHRIYNLDAIKTRLIESTGFKIKKNIFFGDNTISKLSNFWYFKVPKKYFGWIQPIFSEFCEKIDKKTSKEAGNLILFLEK
ncbi:MAG: class I SAM-dependent methyltransferase [bacterium]